METPINKENEETETLEAEKIETLPKKKRIATEKQLKGMEIGRQKLKQKHEELRQKKLLEEEENKKQLEEKIVKKAVSIKKKQIKKELALDEISDESGMKDDPNHYTAGEYAFSVFESFAKSHFDSVNDDNLILFRRKLAKSWLEKINNTKRN